MVAPEFVPKRGAVALVRFPFSDLSETKLRLAVLLADAEGGDWMLCQVTSKPYGDARAIVIEAGGFASGSLRLVGHARPRKIFTANQSLIVGQAGILKAELCGKIIDSVVALLRGV
jgi:mRNA interferase MazF